MGYGGKKVIETKRFFLEEWMEVVATEFFALTKVAEARIRHCNHLTDKVLIFTDS